MKARVTKIFKAVAEDQVYPEQYVPGKIVTGIVAEYALRNGWGEPVKDTAAESVAAASTLEKADAAEETKAEGAAVKAKVTKSVETAEDGKPVKLAKGAIVEGQLAVMLIEQGLAVEIGAKPDTKARGAAPENK